MKKEQFLIVIDELKSKLGRWKLETDDEVFADFVIGCCFDMSELKWKVYVNNERGRHRVRLMTENEDEAFDEFLSIVNFEIENNKFS